VHLPSFAENTSTGTSEPTQKKSHSSVQPAKRSSRERKPLPLSAGLKILTIEVIFFDATSSRMQLMKMERERIPSPELPSELVLLVLVAEFVAQVVHVVMAAKRGVRIVNTPPYLRDPSPVQRSRAMPLRRRDRTIRLVEVMSPKSPSRIL
jgi:hypothetical protein